jgi:pheromone shutdown-related protein TraB
MEKKKNKPSPASDIEKEALSHIRKHLSIVGTSHISEQSVSSIKKRVSEFSPDLIAIELDRNRFNSLMEYYSKKETEHKLDNKPKLSDIKRIGLNGFLFSLIGGFFQKKLGDKVGSKPGLDMKAAIDEANRLDLPLILIDQDIEKTLREFSRQLSFREKMRFVYDLTLGPVFHRQVVEFDLSAVPDSAMVSEMISKVRDRYPNVHKVLVEDRNNFMGENIAKLMKNNPGKKILAVVGAGHEEELFRIVGNSGNQILSAYKSHVKEVKDENHSFNYSFSIKE